MDYKFEYETQGAATFLVYQKQPQDVVDSMTMGMISNNKIEGILPFIYVQIDQDTFFKYNVSSYNTLKQYFSGVVTKKRFLKVLESLLSSFILSEEYMLETSAVVLDPSYVFVDPNTSETSVVVLPLIHCAENSVENFMRTLVFHTQFDQSEDCSYIAALINFLNSNQFFSIHKFRELVQDLLHGQAGLQPVKVEEKKAETEIPGTTILSGLAFTPPEQAAPVVEERVPVKKEEQVNTEKFDGSEKLVDPSKAFLPPELPDIPAKEKKPLFGKKKHMKKTDKKGRPAPPPFVGGTPKAPAVKGKSVKPEKKPLFGVKETSKKKPPQLPIPGMNIETPYTAHGVEKPAEPKTMDSSNQGIPVQEVQLKKHSVPTQDFGETVDLRSFSEGTTVLNGTTVLTNPVSEKKFFVKRVQTQEVFELKPGISRVGKDAAQAEICIRGNSAVSRVHMAFYVEGAQLYAEDMRSTNGTLVNGIRLNPGVRSQGLDSGAKVCLGDEELEIIVKN